MSIEIISIGKRTLEHNPILEAIKQTYTDDVVLLETMFTWDVPKAIERKREMIQKNPRKIIIDGPGWRNLGNEGVIDLSSLPDMREYVPEGQAIQITKITEGCPNNCEYCYSGPFKVLGIPEFKRNNVKFTDENLLAHPDIEGVLRELAQKRVKGRVVYYEAICGFEKCKLTPKVAELLKVARFKNIRFAWDEPFTDQTQKLAQRTVRTLIKAGYNSKSLSIFLLTNWKVSIEDSLRKLDLMKVWRVKVNDCCYNCNYTDPIPDGWALDEIKYYRRKARQHNQLVLYEIFPEENRRKIHREGG